MADISTEIAEIQEASYGSEVRQSIVDGLNKVNAGTLPAVSVSDAGKFLTVNNNGQWEVKSGGLIPTPTGTKSITENGIYDVTNYASADVDVQGSGVVIQPLSVTQNGTYTPPSGVDGYAPVAVNVSGGGGDPYTSDVIQTQNTKLFDRPQAFFLNRVQQVYPIPDDVDDFPTNAPSKINMESGKSYTAYLVAKTLVNDNRILNFFNAGGSLALVCIYFNANRIIAYNNGASVVIKNNATDYYATAISYNQSNGKFRFYIDKAFSTEYTSSGIVYQKLQLNGTDNSYMNTEYVKHFALVEGVDDDSTIIANLTALETLYGIS